MEPILMTPEEVSDSLRVSRSRVYLWIATGVLPSCTLGKSRRVPRQALLDWLEKQSTMVGVGVGTPGTDGREAPG